MANTYYTIKSGDTLTSIAKKYSTTVSALLALNPSITNANLIIAGETIVVSGTAAKSTSSTAKVIASDTIKIGPQAKNVGTIVARWTWTRSNTDHYEVKWGYYISGDSLFYEQTATDTKFTYATYNPPDTATRIGVSIKPIATKSKNSDGEESYAWTDTQFSTWKYYNRGDDPPSTPSKPSVEYKDGKLTMSLDDIADSNATHIRFRVIQDNKNVYKDNLDVEIKYGSVSCEIGVSAGSEYKVQCKALKKKNGAVVDESDDWSSYSETISTAPTAMGDILVCQASSSTSVYLMWAEVKGATSYEIEHTTKLEYFKGSSETHTETTTSNTYYVSGLDSGMEYFFRVKAINNAGETDWSPIKSIVLGTEADAPTTWSSTTIAVTGEPLYLYWVHNCEDESRETKAEIELIVNDGTPTIETIQNGNIGDSINTNSRYYISEYDHESVTIVAPNLTPGTCMRFYVRRADSINEEVFDEKYTITGTSKTVKVSGLMPETAYCCNIGPYTPSTYSTDWWGRLDWSTTYEETENLSGSYKFDTSGYTDGAELRWKVRTAGVTGVYGDWSIQRRVDIYAPATLAIRLKDYNGNSMDKLTQFPFTIETEAGPASQEIISFHLTVVANEAYETVDITGVEKYIGAGSEIYSKYFDINEQVELLMSAYDIDLENNITYTVKGVVTMSSGLTAEDESSFTVAWVDEDYAPTAEIGIDNDTYSAVIRPYCFDENYDLVDGVTLAVYRREYDGSFTEIATRLRNTYATYVVDPHVALDLARYRIVAISDDTGAVSYRDVSSPSAKRPPIVIQWDETWTEFDMTDDGVTNSHPWTGSMLKLPYNVDISPSTNVDVAHVEYAGRKHPVSYYGTQLGETASWSTVIPKSDKDTLYALRRLSIWTGDVYVREPSGMGYWATISVSYNIKHCEVTVPVTLDITRVEGGM